MTNIEKIKQLAGAVDADLLEEVESVILNAGKYVDAVTTMECAALNLQNRKGEDYRSEVSRTDAARSRAHNALDRKSTRLNSSHPSRSRMPSSA